MLSKGHMQTLFSDISFPSVISDYGPEMIWLSRSTVIMNALSSNHKTRDRGSAGLPTEENEAHDPTCHGFIFISPILISWGILNTNPVYKLVLSVPLWD